MAEGAVSGDSAKDVGSVAGSGSAGQRIRFKALRLWCWFAFLAVVLTWPLVLQPRTHLPLGRESSDTVALLNSWTMWWNVDRMAHGFAGYWDAPIFHPSRGSFLLGEPQPVTGALSWPLLKTVGQPGTYNFLLLISLTLNGWFGCRLLRDFQVSDLGQWIGGSWILALPLIHASLGVFQVVPIWCVLWSLSSSYRLIRSPLWGRAVELAIAMAVTYGMNCHYGLFLLTLLPFWTVLNLGRSTKFARVGAQLAVAVVGFAVLVAPLVVPQWSRLHYRQVHRNVATVSELSASPARYATPGNFLKEGRRPVDDLGIGIVKSLLAVGSLLLLTRCHSTRALWGLGVVAVLFSMAPRLGFDGATLYDGLSLAVPGFASVRNVFRYAVFVQICAISLGVIWVESVWRCNGVLASRESGPSRRFRFSGPLAWCVIGALGLIESWPSDPQLQTVPPQNTQWATFISEQTDPNAIVAVVPLGRGVQARDHRLSALAMYLQPVHQRKMINGYNGFFPASHRDVLSALRQMPSTSSLSTLQAKQVTHLVVFGNGNPDVMKQKGWMLQMRDEKADVEIWKKLDPEMDSSAPIKAE